MGIALSERIYKNILLEQCNIYAGDIRASLTLEYKSPRQRERKKLHKIHMKIFDGKTDRTVYYYPQEGRVTFGANSRLEETVMEEQKNYALQEIKKVLLEVRRSSQELYFLLHCLAYQAERKKCSGTEMDMPIRGFH